VFCTTKANIRATIEQLKQLMLNNNTSGASIYDLGSIIKSDNIAEIDDIMKKSDKKIQQQKQAEMQHQQQLQDQQLQATAQEEKAKREFEASENQKDREARIVESEIKASGYGAMKDINANQQSDFIDAMDQIKSSDEYAQSMDLKRTQETNKVQMVRDKISVEREKIAASNDKAKIALDIARENKTKSELQAAGKLKEKKAKEAQKKKK